MNAPHVSAGQPLPAPPDFEFLRGLRPLFHAYRTYFRARVRGWERLPEGAALLVGNHNGGYMMPEAPLTVLSYHHATGYQDPLVILGHDLAFMVPGLTDFVRRCGTIQARSAQAEAALRAGRRVFVYPGGDREVVRPSRDRDRVDFGQRAGFARLALRAGVPVVPVVAAGAHDVWWVLTRGERIARWLRLDRSRLRLNVFPLVLSLPWGLTSGLLPFLPWPSRILLEVGEPLTLVGDPDNPADVARAADEVRGAMQDLMDRLVGELRAGSRP